jgi:hypothetical protein
MTEKRAYFNQRGTCTELTENVVQSTIMRSFLHDRQAFAHLTGRKPAQIFRRKVIKSYTNNNFQEVREDEWGGSIQTFSNEIIKSEIELPRYDLIFSRKLVYSQDFIL